MKDECQYLALLPERPMTEKGLQIQARLVCANFNKLFTNVISEIQKEEEVTTLADPWIRLLAFDMMAVGGTWHIKGTSSKSCLRNMERFMDYWHTVAPEKCRETTLVSEQVDDDSQEPTDDSALLPFSGGLDACYTAYRHTHGLAGHKNLDIRAAMMIHGADIPLCQQENFDAALQHNRSMLNDLGITKIHVIRTDYRTVGDNSFDWGVYTHMAVLIGLASFLSPLYKNVVAGSSNPYTASPLKWGSNPISDMMLSSLIFSVWIDDCSKNRTEKAALVSQWKVGMQNLRVCWESAISGTGEHNCGHCEKCVRTNLNFLACGVQLPCMPVLRLKEISDNRGEIHLLREYAPLVNYARQHGCNEPWVDIMEQKIARCQRKLRWPRGVKRIWNKGVLVLARVFYRSADTPTEKWKRRNFIHYNSIPM